MKPKILVVDNKPEITELIVRMLNTSGLWAEGTTSSKEALEKIKSNGYRLLISDVVMPDINGIELVRKVHERNPRLEAILVSAYGTESTQEKLERMGVFGYLEKPVSGDNLLNMAEKAVKSDRILRLGYSDKETVMQFNRERVLLVDDNENILNMLSRFMTSHGFRVTTALNGSIAYEQMLLNDFDLIIMDINMPRMNGVEAVKAVREHDSDTFILLISGEADSSEIEDAMRNGANKFLEKPFDFEALLQVIDKIDFKAIATKKKWHKELHRRRVLKKRTWVRKFTDPFRIKRNIKVIVQMAVILAICIAVSRLTVWLVTISEQAGPGDAFLNRVDKLIDAVRGEWGR
jgi:DNA-binding NtrC family response regulator